MKKFLLSIGGFFKRFGEAVTKGDWAVKMSMLVMGIGYIRRKQIIKGILITLLQGGITFYLLTLISSYLVKFGTLGTVQMESVYNPATKKNEMNDYDNSFKILLFGIVAIVLLVAAVAVWLNNIIKVRELQVLAENNKHINTFKEDLSELLNKKFHVTLLTLPVLGIMALTVIPLFVMIAVAFTEYDRNHLVPTHLFSWVGFENIKTLFSMTSGANSFGYAFTKILIWTLVWAFFATFTTYFGGILLSMFINNKNTKWKKMWRTLFVITIAVPQFVSLLLVRNFFSNNGIVNYLCSEAGITSFLQTIGLVSKNLSYIPFLSSPGWAKFTIIVINIWIGVPYLMLIATGVLMNIPSDMMESARIDGANGFQVFTRITMPYMLFVTGPYLVTSFVNNINNFNVIFLLTQDVYYTLDQKLANSNAKEVDLLVTWLYRLTQEQSNYKMASVIGIVVFVICAGFTLLMFNQMIKGNREENFQA